MFRLEYISRPPALHSAALLLFVALKRHSALAVPLQTVSRKHRETQHVKNQMKKFCISKRFYSYQWK